MIFQIKILEDFNCRNFMNFDCENSVEIPNREKRKEERISGKRHCLPYLYIIYNKQIIKCPRRRIEIETFYSYILNVIGVCASLMNVKFNFLSTLHDWVFNQTRIDFFLVKTLIFDHGMYYNISKYSITNNGTQCRWWLQGYFNHWL